MNTSKANLDKILQKFSRNLTDDFKGSASYWESRYTRDGNSGSGSYGRLATYKADVINSFIDQQGIQSVLEFGCGDGNQLTLAKYPNYIGVDVSESAIELCSQKFESDHTKSFFLLDTFKSTKSDLVLSLDVIYHLVEDEIFESHMEQVFDNAIKFVIIYASNINSAENSTSNHVRHHKFTDWIEVNKSDQWKLLEIKKNPYPFKWFNRNNTSHADFYIYQRFETSVS